MDILMAALMGNSKAELLDDLEGHDDGKLEGCFEGETKG
jgi:hypothetical protein